MILLTKGSLKVFLSLTILVFVSSAWAVDRYEEKKDNKVVIKYKDYPVSVKVSRDEINVVTLPYTIRAVDTSKEGIKDISRSDKEFTISVLKNQNTDLSIVTTDKTFIVTLIPSDVSATHVVIEDLGIRKKEKEDDDSPQRNFNEDINELMRQAIEGTEIEGFYMREVGSRHDSPDCVFIMKKLYEGPRFNVAVIDAINKTNDVLRIRADMKYVKYVISKVAGKPVATSVSREFIMPKEQGKEEWGEHISTIYAIVMPADVR